MSTVMLVMLYSTCMCVAGSVLLVKLAEKLT